MHSKAQFHHSIFGISWNAVSTAFAIMLTLLILIGVIVFITVTAPPAQGQNSVPPTAVQAAKMPQFASRLAPPTGRPAAGQLPALAPPRLRRAPLQDGVVYENGPVNGNTDAWTINFGFIVSDSFNVTQGNDTSITGMSFAAWLFPGDTMTSAQVSITSNPFGGTTYFTQTVNFTQSGCALNSYGYNVCLETSSAFSGVALNDGTYWVNLQNASVPSGDPLYWDENSGIGCQSPGCPSQADENSIGTIPSESFTILGNSSTVPPPTCFTDGVQVLHNFTTQEGSGNGVAIDQAGNLYGTTTAGGNDSAGFAFRLARSAGWLPDALYSFAGGYNGGSPTGAIVGPNGTLYGGAAGGNQNGLVFNLTPAPTACLTSLCSWMETVPYRFNGGVDASGAINVSAFDQEGNLYGTSEAGGGGDCNGGGCGTVFKLTPTLGGWTESILYSFTGGNDGANPNSLLVGLDGNLYGTATEGGAYGLGVVFQLAPSGNGWIESVLHSFQGTGIDGYDPSYLGQDGAGNLYGIAFWYFDGSVGPIFMLQKSGGGWIFREYQVHHPYGNIEILNNLIVDSAGNLYGTGGGGQGCASGGRCNGSPDSGSYIYAYIFAASYGSGGWQYGDLVFFNYQFFPAGGPMALDARGNLYGTTGGCGTYNTGTVWELSR